MIIAEDTRSKEKEAKKIVCKCRICGQNWVVPEEKKYYVCMECELKNPTKKKTKALQRAWKKKGLI